MDKHSSARQSFPAPPAPVDAAMRTGSLAIPQPRRHAQRAAAAAAAEQPSHTNVDAARSEVPRQPTDRQMSADPSNSTAHAASSRPAGRSGAMGFRGGAEHAMMHRPNAAATTSAADATRASPTEPSGAFTAASKLTSVEDQRLTTTRGSHGTPVSPKRRSRDRGSNGEDRHHSHENLHIRNVPLSMDERTLRTVFSQFGNITSAVIMRNIHTGESQGKAFVRFESEAEAAGAMEALNAAHSSAKGGAGGKGGRSHGSATGGRAQSSTAAVSPALVFTDEKGRHMTAQWARKQHDSAPVGPERKKMRKLFVRNIPVNITTEMLESLFRQFGTVSSVSIHHDTRAAMDTAPRHHNSGTASPIMNIRASAVSAAVASGNHDDERRIAFITYLEEGVAAEAAQQVHNTTPFASCCGVPLMVKLAEDTPARHNTATRTNSSGANTKPEAGARPTSGSTASAHAMTNPGPGSGLNSLNTTLSQMPSASSPMRMSPAAPFPGPMGMVSLATLSQDGNGGAGGMGFVGSTYPHTTVPGAAMGLDGSPVLAHSHHSTSSLPGQGFLPDMFSSLNQSGPIRSDGAHTPGHVGPPHNGSSGGFTYPHGSPSVPLAYMSLNASPRFGTPAGPVPAVALPSTASLPSTGVPLAGPWGAAATTHTAPGLGYDSASPPSQAMTGSPSHGSLTGTTAGGAATPPVLTSSCNAMPPWSAAASGAGSPVGTSLFPPSAATSPSGLVPSSTSGAPYRLATPAAASGAAASAVPPHVYMPVPVYPSSSTSSPPGVRRDVGGGAVGGPVGGPESASAPTVPTPAPPSQGPTPPFTSPLPPAAFVDPQHGATGLFFTSPTTDQNGPFHAAQPYAVSQLGLQGFEPAPAPPHTLHTMTNNSHIPLGGGNAAPMGTGMAASHQRHAPSQSNRLSEVSSPCEAGTSAAASDAMAAFLKSLTAPRTFDAQPVRPGHGHVSPSQPMPSHPRNHSSTTSDSGNDSASTGGAPARQRYYAGAGADETGGLTGSHYRTAQPDDTSVVTSSTSAEVSPQSKTRVADNVVSVLTSLGQSTSLGGSADPDVWPAASSKHRAHGGFKRPTMSPEAIRNGHAAVFDEDFHVFTPVTAAGGNDTGDMGRGSETQAVSRGARTAPGEPVRTHTDRSLQVAERALPMVFAQLRADACDDAASASVTSAEGSGSLEQHPSSHSFMNEEALQQLMNQFAPASEDGEFLLATDTPSPCTGE